MQEKALLMNTNDLNQVLASILQRSADGLEKGIAMASDQIPKVAQDYIAWKVTDNAVSIAFALAWIACAILLLKWHRKKNHDSELEGIICLVVVFCMTFWIGSSACSIVKALAFPRIVLIEAASKIASGKEMP